MPARLLSFLLIAGVSAWALIGPASAGAQTLRRPVDPQRLTEARRAPMTLTPFVTIVEEFNDNIFLDNDRKEWDFITRITPGLLFEAEGATHRLAAAYSFTADIFARHPERSGAFNHHNLAADARWDVTPRLTLNATEAFTFSTDTNLLAPDEVATGRDQAWSNSLGLGASYQLDRLTRVRGGVSWIVQRYDSELLRDSDTYGVDLGLDRTLTPRLTGGAEYAFRHFEVERADDATAHMPRLAVAYRFTETLSGRLAAGPAFVQEDDELVVTPTFTASLSQAFRWGNLGVDAARVVGTAGGLGGVTVNHSIGVTAQLTTLMRGLVVEAGPRWAMRESLRGDEIDLWTVVLPIQATYRFREGLALVAAYNFFLQRSDSRVAPGTPTSLARDVDQNRLWIGVQFGYPIRFE
ncbi:MAG TPA: hypothetical protein VNO23_01530 [Candidatus Binatia bacterium]|nr:hypothetical protein [Candidatus Binatia bacterium]